jgi:glycosyltransferase involved in cell wall biosynthesis
MGSRGVQIAIIIEKCNAIPDLSDASNLSVYPQKRKQKWIRPFELMLLLARLHKAGYTHIFIRISWVAAVVSIITSWFTRQKTWFWLSGQGSFEHYNSVSPGLDKLRLFVSSRLPFWFIKTFVHRFVTGPESLKDYMVKQGNVREDKIAVLYNDVQVARFTPMSRAAKEEARLSNDIPQQALVILFVHRFSPVRKTSFYLPYLFQHIAVENNLKVHQPILFLMVGSGPEWARIKEETSSLQLPHEVRWMGDIPNKKIQAYYQIADLFINPTWAEGFPRVILEAMASGIPIVTTDAGGIRDILGKHQSAFIVPKEDRALFAKKCNLLLSNVSLRDQVSAENNTEIARFDTPVVAQMYIDILFHA